MNPHQQQIIKDKIAKDHAFIGSYMQEITSKRALRQFSVQTAIGIETKQQLNQATGKLVSESPSSDTVIECAEKIYKYVTQDGGFEDLAKEATVKLLSRY